MLTLNQRFIELNGRFTLSDDSHGVDQVGLNFPRILESIKKAGIEELVYLAPAGSPNSVAADERFPHVTWVTISLKKLEAHRFWKS